MLIIVCVYTYKYHLRNIYAKLIIIYSEVVKIDRNLRLNMTITYTITHFLVDFACSFLMFCYLQHTSDWYLCVLLYNFCAFAMQMPLGILADVWNKNYFFAAVGCLFIALSFALISYPLFSTIIAGVGNGMFHVGGGIDVLNLSGKKSVLLGIFISPGALGIYLGRVLSAENSFPLIVIIPALIIAAGIILAVCRGKGGKYSDNLSFGLPKTNSFGRIKTISLFIVVFIRSFVGLSLNFQWANEGSWLLIIVICVVIGKAVGGILNDWIGAAKCASLSLCFSSFLFLLPQFPFFGVLAVLFFNMTMPVTLFEITKIFPNAKGFAFGLLTFALFLGFLPVYFGYNALFNKYWYFSVSCVLSLLLILVSVRKENI